MTVTDETDPTVPRPRRPATTRRPLGPAGRGPGSTGRGPTRTAPRRDRLGAPGAPLPTVGAQRRAQQNRPHLWFAHQLVLTLSGQRPVHALLGHALPAAYDRLAELAPQAPLRPLPGPGGHGALPAVRECGLCRPRSGVIEAFARITAGERLRALAFRLELGADSRWRCAALDIGPTPAAQAPAR
ncbi:Rv3235 family protein [Streptomyces sp. NPDC048506]|uniref:Rv3235 family protein n=1 Tax=Streptomyces sp. NPDC048506 TaxID=3155028 RepID=UPI003443B6AA